MPVRALAGGDAACMHVHAVGPMQMRLNACGALAVEIAGVRDTTAAAMPVMRVRGRVDHVLTADCIIGAADAVVVIEIQHA